MLPLLDRSGGRLHDGMVPNARSFLRSPPFPGVSTHLAAVSAPLHANDDPVDIGDEILEMVTAGRVGGCFWGAQVDGVRLAVSADLRLPEALDGMVDRSEIGMVPGGRRFRTAACAGRILPDQCDPWLLVEQADLVCAREEDEIAIVAALLGKPVYGPQGALLPPDLLRANARRLLAHARYRDCFTGDTAGVEQVVSILADWRRHIDGNRGIAAVSGISFWKRDHIRRLLWNGHQSPPIVHPRSALAAAKRSEASLAVWPSRVPRRLAAQAAASGVPFVRIEDGFLRSRGLGAALHPPSSIVVDRTGLYYDANQPSDLEHLLAHHPFSPSLMTRAARLRTRVRATGATKYGDQGERRLALPEGRRTVLAIGQVDDDMSVALGGCGIAGNADFLERVRADEPDAWIVYRPHPDVQAGHRKGHLSDAAILRHADAVDSGGGLMALVEAVDAVHVLSSLTGFEALMRDRPVSVHGMPFYAGWGLTRDLAPPNPRRGRRLTIDQLVAAALILYPRYLDPVTGLPCGPEVIVERITSGTQPPMSMLIKARMLQGRLRRMMTLFAESVHG